MMKAVCGMQCDCVSFFFVGLHQTFHSAEPRKSRCYQKQLLLLNVEHIFYPIHKDQVNLVKITFTLCL